MSTPNLVPRADSEGGIGTASKYWGSAYIDLIYVGAGKIGRDADNLIDFSTDNRITFRVGASNVMVLNSSSLRPNTDNGLPLGTSTVGWSDLFLASGAVINFDEGNVTLTHSSNALTLADSDVLAFGAGSDLQLYHNGTDSFLLNTEGHLEIINFANDKDIIFKSDDGSGGVTAYLTLDGSAANMKADVNMIFADNKAAMFGDGDDFQLLHNGTNSYIQNYTGDLYINNWADNKDIIFQSDDGSGGVMTYFFLDGSQGATIFPDNRILGLGTGADLQIRHTGTDGQIKEHTGNLNIINNSDDGDITFQSDNGAGDVATYFYLDGSSAIHNGSATTALFTNFPDNSHVSFGTSHDFQIDHDGNHAVLYNQTGHIYISNDQVDGDIVLRSDDGSGGVTAYMYLDGSYVGTRFPQNVQLEDNVELRLGTNQDLRLEHTGSNGTISNYTGNLTITNNTDDSDIIFQCDNGSGGVTDYMIIDGSAKKIQLPAINLQFADSVAAKFGDGNDLQIHHDGSNSYINDTGTGGLVVKSTDLYLRNASDADYIHATSGGAVKIYHNAVKKLETTATGISVTGGITVTGDSSVFTSANANDPVVEIKNTTNDNDAARLQFTKDRGAAAQAGDNIAQIDFVGENTAQETILYSRWVIDNNVASDGQEGGKIQLLVATHDAELQVGLELIDGNAEDEVDVTIANGAGSLTTVSGDLTVVGDVVMMPNLPTSDPSVAGQLWNDSNTLKISAG